MDLSFFMRDFSDNNIIVNRNKKIIDLIVTDELISHYKSIAANFLEVEVL